MNKQLQAVLFLIAVQFILGIRLEKARRKVNEFCWSHKYAREGTELKCLNGKQWGMKCYEDCPLTSESFGEGCRTKCPEGRDWRDDGLYCRRTEYTRPGFPIKFGELSDSGMIQRCESTYGVGNCEKYIGIVYPKCPTGYTREGCCICRPSARPDCSQVGLADGIDISCKKIYSDKKPVDLACAPDEFFDGQKCYPNCMEGYEALGTICQSVTPKGWVQCGFGHAATAKDCKNMNKDELFKLYFKIYNIARNTIDPKCKVLCDIKKSIIKTHQLMLKIQSKKLNLYGELVKSQKHEELFKQLFKILKEAVKTRKPTRKDLEDILLIAEKIIQSFNPTLFEEHVEMVKYPICS